MCQLSRFLLETQLKNSLHFLFPSFCVLFIKLYERIHSSSWFWVIFLLFSVYGILIFYSTVSSQKDLLLFGHVHTIDWTTRNASITSQILKMIHHLVIMWYFFSIYSDRLTREDSFVELFKISSILFVLYGLRDA